MGEAMFDFILNYYNYYIHISKNPCLLSDPMYFTDNIFPNTIIVNCNFGEIMAYIMMALPVIGGVIAAYIIYKLFKYTKNKLTSSAV